MKRLTLILFTLILIASVFWVAVVNGISQIPHENPATAKSRFNIAPSLLHYSDIFDQVASRRYLEARVLIQRLKLDYVHLPEEMTFIMTRFADLTTDLTKRLDNLDSILDACEQLLSQNKLDAASVKLGEARELVDEVAELIENIGMATEELLAHLAPFVSPREAEAVNTAKVRLQRAVERLAELEAWYRNKLNSLETEAEEKEDLSTTELTLSISPAQVWVGEHVTLSGTLKAEDIPLPARDVSIFLAGSHFTAATVMEDGSYEASFALPYWYTPEIRAQAFYLPQGNDKSSFTASSSAIKKIAVLFHPTSLKIEAPEKAYPGLSTEISGEVSSEGNILGRNVEVSLGGEPLFEATTDDRGLFQHQVLLPRETQVGDRKLRITVAPDNKSRSAGTSIEQTMSVVKVTPEMTVHAPKAVALPQRVDLAREVRSPFLLQGRVEVTGEVHSPLPLAGAAVTLEMGGTSTTSTINEGSFKLELDLPFQFDIVGFEEMEVNLAPSEPWHLPTRRKASIFVVNLIYLGTALAAVILAGVALITRGMRTLRRKETTLMSPGELETPATATELHFAEIKPDLGDNRGIILRAYYMTVAGVQRLARVLFKPQMTLREFLSQVTPSLGRLTELFAKLTNLAEKVLYSRHVFGNEEASLAQGLASELRKGWLMISHWF